MGKQLKANIMKKLLLVLVATLFTISLNAQSSETEFKFDDYKQQYSKLEISFGGEYNKSNWQLKKGDQYIYLTQDDLDKATIEIEKAFNKAVEWDKVADENNVDKLNKKMDFSFRTTGGMLNDSGFEGVGPHDAEFKFERFEMSGKTYSYMSCNVWQSGDYGVRSANCAVVGVNVRDESQVQAFNKFLNFLKNSKTLVLERIAKEKEKTKVFN